MDFSLPKNILNIISTINDCGFNAHIVGGCVRDILLRRSPSDWDITTNASPGIIKSLFKKTYDTGIRHGTVTVILDDIPYEITTWRKESGYSDHRRPDHVYAAETLKEDLARRDFTMNAIAYHPTEGIIDPYGGYEDIRNKIIRCVGNPYERFSEDSLRMLRAVRFSSQLDFNIENNTKKAIDMLSANLSYISKERIQIELNKILESNLPEKMCILWETGLFEAIFPGIKSLSPIWLTTAKNFINSPNQKRVLLSLLFYVSFQDNTHDSASKLLNYLKYDNETKRCVSAYLKCMENFGTVSLRNIRRAATEFGVSVAADTIKALRIIRPDKKATAEINEISPILLSLKGTDLKNAGYEGKTIKNMLSVLSLCIYEKPELNNRETLLEIAGSIEPPS